MPGKYDHVSPLSSRQLHSQANGANGIHLSVDVLGELFRHCQNCLHGNCDKMYTIKHEIVGNLGNIYVPSSQISATNKENS